MTDTVTVLDRPDAMQGTARREAIMQIAEEMFVEQGYDATTTSQIAARAGASKATIYKFFPSKAVLFSEIIRGNFPDLTGPSAQELHDRGGVAEVMTNWSERLYDQITRPSGLDLYKLIIAESDRCPELAEIFKARGPGAVHRQLSDYLAEASANGHLDCREPHLAARLFISMVFGDGFDRAQAGHADTAQRKQALRRYIEEAVAMFLARYGIPQSARADRGHE